MHPFSISNWLAFEQGEPWLGSDEFPLFTDAWLIGEIEVGPYYFINTVAGSNKASVKPAIVLRYAMHRSWDHPDFSRTDTEFYHAGSPTEEVAALASLAMGVRLRAGRSIRRFQPNADPSGRPQEIGDQNVPYFVTPTHYNVPSAGLGEHALGRLEVLPSVLRLSRTTASSLVRAARMYQDALWLIESEPELAWLLLVSSLEIAANEWQKERGDAVKRLETSKPELYEFLLHHEDPEILRRVADSFADSLGITRKFVDFVLEFLPSPPNDRPGELWAQFEWTQDNLRRAMKAIYSYRSKALHDGRPFPLPMCSLPHHDRSWKAPAEIMTSLGTSDGTGTWLKKDVPMHLHLFEYIAREVLLKWWTVCATSSRS